MTPFITTELQKELLDEVARFTREEMARFELIDAFDREAWDAMAGFGLVGLPFPGEYEGGGADLTTTVLALETFARCGGSLSLALSLGASAILCGIPILNLGSREQKEKFLPGLASGRTIGGFGLTEPDSGSDAAALRTRAVRSGDGYLLNGTKMFITNGPIGDLFVVLALTDPEKGREGITAFLVEKDMAGFSSGRPLNKMGHRGSPTSELIFQDCFVPETNILGEVGRGYLDVAFHTLEWERTCLLGPGAGLCELLLERCVAYSRSRVQFGRPIAEFGAVKQMLGRMRAMSEAGKALWRRVAWMKDHGVPAVAQASTAKLVMSEDCLRVADDAVQIHGGYGYIKEYPVEQAYRDVKLYTLGGGTTQIQLKILSDAALRDSRAGGCPSRIDVSSPFLQALVGRSSLERLEEFRRYCSRELGPEQRTSFVPGASDLDRRLTVLKEGDFWAASEDVHQSRSLVRCMFLDELAVADPWLASAAIATVLEPGQHVPTVAVGLDDTRAAPAPGSIDSLEARQIGHDEYRLSGTLPRLLNLPWVDTVMVTATTGENGETRLFSVQIGGPGVRIALPGAWPSVDGLLGGELCLDEAPATVLGTGDEGPWLGEMLLVQHRLRIASVACGVAASCLEKALQLQGGLRDKPEPPRLQEEVFPLAELLAELDTARLLVLKSAQMLDRDDRGCRVLAAAARLRAVNTARRSAEVLVLLAGRKSSASGTRHGLHRTAVAMALALAGGTDEGLRDLLARISLGDA